MKKLILILLTVVSIFSCKNDKKDPQGNSPLTVEEKQNLVIDINSTCYSESFRYEILVNHSNGKQDTIKGLKEQPNVSECPKEKGVRWCLYDDVTDNLISVDVKSFRVLTHKFDTTEYIICSQGKH